MKSEFDDVFDIGVQLLQKSKELEASKSVLNKCGADLVDVTINMRSLTYNYFIIDSLLKAWEEMLGVTSSSQPEKMI